MDKFNAIVTNKMTIEITSDTYWSCKAEGNFKLSQYDGSGDTIINVIIPEDVLTAEGTVYFTYGDERCSFPQVSILFNNYCYIRTIPSYTSCTFDEETARVVYLFYEEENEIFNMSVFSVGDWEVRNAKNCKYLAKKNELMIITESVEGTLQIVPLQCDMNKIIVNLIKKNN